MALAEQAVNINFGQGLDTKTDPFQVQAGKFLNLQNSVFDKGGQLKKRNGYGPLTSLPVTNTLSLTTFQNNLTAIGTQLYAYSNGSKQWVNKGNLQPLSLNTLSAIRSSTNQSQADAAVASNGLACVVYTDNPPSGIVYKYAVLDSTTGQNIVPPTVIPASGGGTVTGSPRVFILGPYFLVVFTNVISGTSHLDYLAISISNPTMVPVTGEITSSYASATTVAWDAVVYSGIMYIGYNSTTGGQNISYRTITSNLVVSSPKAYAGERCTMIALSVDATNPSVPTIWSAYYDAPSQSGKVASLNTSLNQPFAPQVIISSGAYLNIAAVALSGSVQVYLEAANNYSYDSSIPTHFIATINVSSVPVVGSLTTLVRSVGLASKGFSYLGVPYFLAIYESPLQPSYFLINGLTGSVVAKLAYSNGPGSYYTTGLPAVTFNGTIASIPYLLRDLLQSANKATASGAVTSIYTQTGINLAYFNFNVANLTNGEIGSNLNISGGYIAAYDGSAPTEQGFFLWPDSVEAIWSATGGNIHAQPDGATNPNAYFYQVTYEWTDNEGNLFRSAPSVPVAVTTTGAGTTGSITLNIPTLRLTYKTNVAIVIYRWSVAQENYYQVTSITSPTLNNPTVDSISYTDTLADSSILGNNLIYTTGGVLEDISPPASDNITLFNNRLWLVDAEDRNLLWFSKQVIESTPVEMSDLLTLYVAPTTGSEGSTGPITAINPMDDKLIIFKENALGYINGIGPDNTGANSSYSDFILINSVVGCTAQNSIVFTPQGLMFQSNKGIWLLGRDLSTTYIGAPVEQFTTGAIVKSALNIPTTNQVRFTLSSGITLLYDYYYNQWGTFTNIPAVSSTIYQELQTYVNSFGQVLQETPGSYLDNTKPVLMSFTTSWLNLAGLQGFERFKQLYLLGQYVSPFFLTAQISYDYNPNPVQSTAITPSQTPVPWGSGALWGSDGAWGGISNQGWEGQGNVFEARLFPQRQKCESFQLTISESYDRTAGGSPGAGLTMSGLTLVMGMKRGFRTSRAARNFG